MHDRTSKGAGEQSLNDANLEAKRPRRDGDRQNRREDIEVAAIVPKDPR
jgi:hypothetical protein